MCTVNNFSFFSDIHSTCTFHCPGDRCPIVDISNALSNMCVFLSPESWPPFGRFRLSVLPAIVLLEVE